MGRTVTMSWLAQHWTYLEMLLITRASVGARGGPGVTKTQIVEHLVEHQKRNRRMKSIRVPTMKSYVQAAGRFGLLDVSGNGRRRRYYPPGYLRNDKQRIQANIRELAKMAERSETSG